MTRIWSVFDREYRLVLALSDEPGIFNFARMPEEGTEPIFCHFATLQCYSAVQEAALLEIFARCHDLESLFDELRTRRYKVLSGRPTPVKVARL